ncbi:3-hydroxyacyl- dehydrogenase [Trichoderma arundinaceum]|uniref:3-hydroxyacyl-dehydrogenase n=1 Tax=Trichoderma arundinaceum TaxID=490622 RepID=A0A395NFH7_TRIAR|nr:3-hydroxyacyl- dehydrogenase [Trichoderma arundinaceum]
MSLQIRTVAVIGCGIIGSSWASLFLSRGLKVIIYDPAEGAEERFRRHLRDTWPALQVNGALADLSTENYEFVDNVMPSLLEVDFVQENGPERAEFKRCLMETLDQYTRPGVVIASSSSGLPSSEFIQLCRRDPSRILVGHPFNPPHLVPLVEVVPHPGTSATSISAAMDFYKFLGKRPILLRHEVPGFIANRLQAAVNNEAYSLLSRGIISAEDLDAAVTSGPGLRWALTGPVVTNALGGGGGAEGFMQRIERLGPSIRSWEEDILKHRFDWSDERLSLLKHEVMNWLETIDWNGIKEQRDWVLLNVLTTKSKSNSII